LLTSEHPEPHVVLSEISTTLLQNSNIVVPPEELDMSVERICKAFIRLITAPESEEDLAQIPTSSERSTTRV
jgi:hypothetical protein